MIVAATLNQKAVADADDSIWETIYCDINMENLQVTSYNPTIHNVYWKRDLLDSTASISFIIAPLRCL